MFHHHVDEVSRNTDISQRNNFIGVEVESAGGIGNIIFDDVRVHAGLNQFHDLRERTAGRNVCGQRAVAHGWRHGLSIGEADVSGRGGHGHRQGNDGFGEAESFHKKMGFSMLTVIKSNNE
jgi:hypothetical protein